MRIKHRSTVLKPLAKLFAVIKRGRLVALIALVVLLVSILASPASASSLTPNNQLNELLFGKARVMSESIPSSLNPKVTIPLATPASSTEQGASRAHGDAPWGCGSFVWAGRECECFEDSNH